MNPFELYAQSLRGTEAPQPPRLTTSIRREEGIGLPTLLALAGLAGATALARRPVGRKFLEETWQRPLKGLERWTTPDRPVKLPAIGVPGLPSELPIIRRNPESMLTSEVERVGANMARNTRSLLDQPFTQETLKQGPDAIKDVEHARVSNFVTRMATGMSATQAKAAAMQGAPQWFREANAYRANALNGPFGENWAKRFLGMEVIPERTGPWWARNVLRPESASLRGKGGGLFGDLRTSVGESEHERVYRTMREGMQAGTRYDDPRVAFLNREIAGLRLTETAKLMQRLENRVVFRTADDARAAAGLPRGATVYDLEAVPGAPKWFVPYKEEWKFLVDNLSDPDKGKMAFVGSWANAVARNPNLINPLPHIVKNMAYKYRLAGGALSKLPGDWQEFRRGTSPLVRLFKQYMPFDETGSTAEDMYHRAIKGIRSEQWPQAVKLADLALDATLGRAQRFSSKVIFSQADPAMRYSLWKQYVQKGMGPAEAAQNVWVDLIRYGTRSTLVDFWKSIPFNFFVPWRLGTVTSVYKQLTSHPLRAALVIGAVDLLREIRYRLTGQWTHLPIDYVEVPLAQILQSKDGADSAKSLIAATLMTLAAGPGGGYVFSTLKDLSNDVQGRGEWRRAINMFWGLSQLYNMPQHGWKALMAAKSGDAGAAVSEMSKVLTSAVLAEHSALNYRPRRLMAALPEVGPWLKKSAEVKQAEMMQQAIERRGDIKQRFRDRMKERTIEDRIEMMREGQR